MLLAQVPGGHELLVIALIALIAVIVLGVALVPIALIGAGLYVVFRSDSDRDE